MIAVGQGRKEGDAGGGGGEERTNWGKVRGRLTVSSCLKKRSPVHCSTRDHTCRTVTTPTMVITEYKIR